MPLRKAKAIWEGNLKDGKGQFSAGSGAFEGRYTAGTRFADEAGTNPEELIAAAHAGCFSMALSHGLAEDGHTPVSVQTRAVVDLQKDDKGFSIASITLHTEGDVPGIDADTFSKYAADAKANCPISRALAATEIKLEATLRTSGAG